jgi:isoleucyl-tRNA synthetase
MEYKNTLNLPKTDFPIKVKHLTLEPEILAFWDAESIYNKIKHKNKDKNKKYILHDGPPYPNGDIHLGHALNKILKDIVVKYRSMSGCYSPFIPGWDCHGLPIETQMIKELGVKRKTMSVFEFRKKCQEYALNYVDIQREEFKRLGCLADWNDPYLTIKYDYESRVVELFGILAEKGYVYRGLKPIHWCPADETALAEAEIEYQDDDSVSVYVKFKVKSVESKSPEFRQLQDVLTGGSYFVVWTTTPWTLPANVAIAAHPEFEYAAVSIGDEILVVAEGLLESLTKKLGIKEYKIAGKFKGEILEGIICRHPFMDRDVPIVLDEYVTLEQGTGLVHIAPGHGEEDYQVGLKYKLPIVMPVDGKGFFTAEGGKYAGKRYDEANDLIVADMQQDGSLLFAENMKHSYPHCWRCRKPVIFRATEQWFISVDKHELRTKALKAIGETKWYPAWGENRIRGMVSQRPDWCISRQRSWGVPIPAFYCKDCGKPQYKGVFNKAVAELFRAKGSNSWFETDAKEITAGLKCGDCGGKEFEKETDILDVWFESGASHWAVLKGKEDLSWPADLYLEGSDQHRGWFQSSLLTSVGAEGKAPYRSVLTHGFTVDETGKKMSKSLGNVIDPQTVVKEFGADVLRLWVASTDFKNDMSASKDILKQIADAFSKIRNTCRFIMSNLNDFDPEKDAINYKDMEEIDKFALLKAQKLIEKCGKSYDEFEFHLVFHSIYGFCVNELSSFYFDVIKDRLYCESKGGKLRRSSQTAMNEILRIMVKLYAPVLSFTSEDIWKHINRAQSIEHGAQINSKSQNSIFVEDFPQVEHKYLDKKLEEKWNKLLEIRSEVYRVIENARAEKLISHPLEARVEVSLDGNDFQLMKGMEAQLPSIFIVSEFVVSEGNRDITVKKAEGKKCDRCWMFLRSVGESHEHPGLCDRCVSVVGKMI